MPKARVIVADTDINYIIPLQLKFAEEFFDAIELEIISDRSYFEELFASPQKADILVVSEELYDTSLQRHNISNIFLMTEQYEEMKNRIDSSINLEEIRRIAITELGMTYAGQGQIVEIPDDGSDYVRQYADIKK